MTKLFVGNLSYQLTEEELKQTFQGYGNIRGIRLIQNKGFGFVEFESSESAQKALEELNGKELKGRKMRVEMAKPRESSQPRRDRFRQYGNRTHRSSYSGRSQKSGFNKRRES